MNHPELRETIVALQFIAVSVVNTVSAIIRMWYIWNVLSRGMKPLPHDLRW